MIDNTIKKSREPNAIEKFIIELYVKRTRNTYIELFIFFSACDITFWYFTFFAFSESILIGFTCLIFALVIGLFLLAIWSTIKEAKSKPYKIISDQGTWNVTIEGSSKAMQVVSKVNGHKIAMVVPGMATIPKYDSPKHIHFEYVNLFDSPPFGHGNIFISVEKKGLTEEHKTYIQQLKSIGIFSILLSACFIVSLFFCFLDKFNTPSISFLSLGLFIFFSRTLLRWRHNYKLVKKLT